MIDEQQTQASNFALEQKMQELVKAELARQTVELRGCCRSSNFGNLAKGLGALQAAVSNPVRDKQVEITTKTGHKYRFKYADLASCLDVIRPLLAANGLCILQSCSLIDARAVCVTELLHTSGEFWRSELAFPGSGDIKDLAGTFTYLRRYSLCPILGLAPEDDDQVESQDKDQGQGQARGAKTPAADRASGREPKPAQQAQTQQGQRQQAEKTQTQPPDKKPDQSPPPQKSEEASPTKEEPKAASAPGPQAAGPVDRREAMLKKLLSVIQQVDGVIVDGALDQKATYDAAFARLLDLNEKAPFGQICAVGEDGNPTLKQCSLEQLKDIKAIYDALLVEKEAG